jgi:predicted GNAT family N-acyltransferase
MGNTDPIAVRRVESDSDRDACFALRMRVFVDEQGVPPWEEVDDYDETAEHFVALAGGKVVGTARLVDKGEGIGKVGRVAVEKEFRQLGVGRELMLTIMDFAARHHRKLTLDAQLPVMSFYERFGFVAEGPVFLDAGIEHRAMVTTLRPHDDTD